ncbi:MAG: sigma-70 family RNA polymerase sigma factor [Alphaproteobacteria bacterium]|nr:sigma-70 family RNA polymerase sigma factor [Alphaproteobacteria bacterium]
MVKALKGDGKAYNRALHIIMPLIRRYAFRQMARYGLQDQHEDAVQETLIAIHLKLHTWRQGEPLMPWVYAIARHKVIDILRRNRLTDVSIDEFPYEGAGAVTPHDEVEARMDLDDLLGQLDPPQGEIIRALKINGETVASVAGRYGYTESKVKVMVHRALKKLNTYSGRWHCT